MLTGRLLPLVRRFVPTLPLPAAAISAALVAAPSPAAAPAAQATFRFGDHRATLADLAHPVDAAISTDGRLFVLERDAHRVRIFRLEGDEATELGRFGGFGSGEGEFRFPEGLAVDGATNTLVVADTGNHRVQRFDLAGGFLRQWGRFGARRDDFNRPTGVALGRNRVFVADSNNDRVQVFDLDGRFVASLGGPGHGDGRLRRPEAVASDGAELVAITDTDGDRIVLFDTAARFIRAWGDFGPHAGLLDQPSGLAMRAGELFVADTRNHRIEVFDVAGTLLREWGSHARRPREGDGRLHYPRRLAIAPDGAFAAIVEPFEDRVQLFAALRPGRVEAPREPIPPDEQAHFGRRLAYGGELLAIPQPENHDICVFDLRGEVPTLATRFGERGNRFGQFLRIGGLVVDADAKRILVADEALGRFQTFALGFDRDAPPRFVPLMAKFIRSLQAGTTAAPFARAAWPMQPSGMKRDGRGRLHVADTRNRMVFVYDDEMDPFMSYGGAAAGLGELLEPTDVAIATGDDLFLLVDAGRRAVVAFDQRGRPTGRFGEDRLLRPFGIAAGIDGFVYVTDEAAHRIVVFTERGEHVATFAERGSADGALWKPGGIDQLPDGRLVVVDWGNHRAQLFSPEGRWLASFGLGRPSTPASPRPPDPPAAQDEQ